MTAANLTAPPPSHARACLKKPFELEALVEQLRQIEPIEPIVHIAEAG
jgi:hypothetical protein